MGAPFDAGSSVAWHVADTCCRPTPARNGHKLRHAEKVIDAHIEDRREVIQEGFERVTTDPRPAGCHVRVGGVPHGVEGSVHLRAFAARNDCGEHPPHRGSGAILRLLYA